MQTALRELREETGVRAEQLQAEEKFRYMEQYEARYKRFNGERVNKTLVIFLAVLRDPTYKLRLTEHKDCEWFAWMPPHKIQRNTIDPLLARVAEHFASTPLSTPN